MILYLDRDHLLIFPIYSRILNSLKLDRQEEEFKEKEREIALAKKQAEELKNNADDLQARLDAALADNVKVKDTLTKEQQAAIEAEEQCAKLEGMKNKLEDEVSVSFHFPVKII